MINSFHKSVVREKVARIWLAILTIATVAAGMILLSPLASIAPPSPRTSNNLFSRQLLFIKGHPGGSTEEPPDEPIDEATKEPTQLPTVKLTEESTAQPTEQATEQHPFASREHLKIQVDGYVNNQEAWATSDCYGVECGLYYGYANS
jgi:hypothetical protein